MRAPQLIAVFACAASWLVPAAHCREANPRLVGVWSNDAYGWLMQISDAAPRMFHVLGESCGENTDPDVAAVPRTLGDMRWDADGRGFVAATTENITTFHFRHLDRLPEACVGGDPSAQASPIETFEAFANTFREHYAFFTERGIDWDAICAAFRPRVTATTSPGELFAILAQMIEPLDDRHVAIDAGPIGYAVSGLDPFGVGVMQGWAASDRHQDFWATYLESQQPFKQVVDQRYLSDERTAANGLITWGHLDPAVGYLRVDRFRRLTSDQRYASQLSAFTAALDQAFADLDGATTLVLDLRFNPGGLDGLALHLAGRFVSSPTVAFTKYAVAGGHRTVPQSLTVAPTGSRPFTGPLIILTSRMTQSASENVILALSARPQVIRIGERTAGVHSDELVKPLPNGWSVTISNEVFLAADGRLFETRGFEPDYSLPYLASDVLASQRDAVIDAARSLVRSPLLSLRAGIENDIREFAAETQAPAVAVGILSGDDVVLRAAIGLQRIGDAVPATVQTLFHMASVSKPFVATAIMQLADAGKLDPDGPAYPHVSTFELADPRWARVTIAQLMNHTAGLPDVEEYDWDRPQNDAGALDRYLAGWKRRRMIAAPGATIAYSNLGYEVLAGVIEQVSGRSFEGYMQSNVLDPLHMQSSSFLMPDDQRRLAWPHETRAGKVVPLATYPYNRSHAASSTLHASVDDMLKFAQLHLDGAGAEAIGLSSQSLARQHAAVPLTFQHTVPIDRSPAFGWFAMQWQGRRLIVHEGQDDGFTSMLLLEPGARNAIVLMVNLNDDGSSLELWNLTLRILDRLPH